MTTILALRGLGKDYGDRRAVDAVDLEITAGTIVGLLGPNGALALYEDLSARQNLIYFGRLYGLAGAELDQRVAWALDLAGLADRATEPVDRFSGGMKRRLKLVPYILIGVVQLGFLFGVGALAFGMQVAGSVVGLVALSVAVVVCATALGLLLATVGKSEKAIGAFAPPVLLVMGMLGGCMFPRLLMPEVMQTVGLAVPHAWALDGYHALLVRPGTTVVDVVPQIGAILGFAVVFAGLGLARFRFER